MSVCLRGMTWDHPRGRGPMGPVSAAFARTPAGRAVRIMWDAQPLAYFESRPLAELCDVYDLLVIDHPHVGDAEGCLLPLEMLEDVFVGPSLASYVHAGCLWAAPIDAACHVSAYRAEAIESPPTDWEQLEWMIAEGLRVGLPLMGVHALMGMCTLLASAGAPLDAGRGWPQGAVLSQAAALYRRVAAAADPRSARWNPIQALEALAAGSIDYIPMTFGYAGFASPRTRFAPVPAWPGRQAAAGILGGAGLAVSAKARDAPAAAAFARFASSHAVQVDGWADHGGQPAHRAAWQHLAERQPFYRDTLPAFEHTYVRPRFAGWNALQSRMGRTIETWLLAADSSVDLLSDRLNADWAAAKELNV